MGAETANVHLGTPDATRAILKDLNRRSKAWLEEEAKSMGDLVESDWQEWTGKSSSHRA
jgi:hypothetical protein